MSSAASDPVALVSLWQEVNTYSPRPTTIEQFRELELLAGEEIAEAHRGTGSVIGAFLDAASFPVVPLISARAWPAGPADAETSAGLLGMLDDALSAAGRVSGALLYLHGAMVTRSHPDLELAVARRVREAVGEGPIVAVLDLHGIPSVAFVEECQAVIAYDTYPHVDMEERGIEAARLMEELRADRLRSVVGKVPLLTCPVSQATAAEPMSSLQRFAQERARAAGLKRISLLPGFPYCDVERAGFSVIATAKDVRLPSAAAVAREVCKEIERRADEFRVRRDPPAVAVAKGRDAEAPCVLADVADNIGAGGTGDRTALLAELIRQRVTPSIVLLASPEIAVRAVNAGVGARVQGPLGTRLDQDRADRVYVDGEVIAISDGRYQAGGEWMRGHQFAMGRTAAIDLDGVVAVVTERPTPPFHVEQLTHLGLDPHRQRVIALKGAVAVRAPYGGVARTFIEVDTPGVCPLDPSVLTRATRPQRRLP